MFDLELDKIKKIMNVLYIGSGNSAKLIDKLDLSKYTVVCVNNAWRLFQDSSFDVWIHSGDFPKEHSPKIKMYHREVSAKDYSLSTASIINSLNIDCKSPQHYVGYTIFFQGIYWIMNELKPEKISLLGFDHDYNQSKVDKWNEHKRPNIQNKFNNKQKKQNITEWLNLFYDGMETDFFYGHGSPDPMRLGTQHLIDKFEILKKNAQKLNISIVNLSPIISPINTIEKEMI